MLSKSALEATLAKQPLLIGLSAALDSPFSSNNPNGIINLGTAANTLPHDLILTAHPTVQITSEMLSYGDFSGSHSLRETLSNLLNRRLTISPPILPNEMTVHSGCSSAVCNLIQCLANPGDGIMIPSPYYGGFDVDTAIYAHAQIIPVPTKSSNGFMHTLQDLQVAYETAMANGIPVKVLLLTNPHNPQGTIISKTLMESSIAWAESKNLQVIVDEIYALSVFDPVSLKNNEFVSMFNLKHDPQSTHFLWGLSKDFTMNGVRMGVFVSRNKVLVDAMKALGFLTNVSSLADKYVTQILSDHDFVDSFISTNQERLWKQYQKTTSYLDSKGIQYQKSTAGFFVWINLGPYLTTKDSTFESLQEAEKALWLSLIDQGVLISPGATAFHCPEPGWFRVIFTVEWNLLQLGLDRICSVLSL